VIGEVYVWKGRLWLVLARGEPFDRGPRRNVLLVEVAPMSDVVEPRSFCTLVGGACWYRGHRYPTFTRDARIWLVLGERVVRPFRGLRRADIGTDVRVGTSAL
jgi:hypothetical protein